MKIWKKVKFKDSNKEINVIAKALTNYLWHDNFVYTKLGDEARNYLNQAAVNKIAGILMLYYAKDYSRINDIVNKYNQDLSLEVIPEIEGYLQK